MKYIFVFLFFVTPASANANDCILDSLASLSGRISRQGAAARSGNELTEAIRRGDTEVTASASEMNIINGAISRTGGDMFPVLSSRSASVITSLQRGQRVEVSYKMGLGDQVTRVVTREEALELLQAERIEGFSVTRAIPMGRSARLTADQARKIQLTVPLNIRSSELQTVLVRFSGGEVGTFTGNSQMIRNLATNDDVVRITAGNDAPSWIPSTFTIGHNSRRAMNPLDDFAEQLRSGNVIRRGDDLGYDNFPIYHGTIREMEASVRSGPRNVGAGFGGRGLYIARESDLSVAVEYASHAKTGAANRVRNINPNASVDEIDSAPIVMRGRLNPDKNFRVGVFQVNGNITRPNLRTGELPTNWNDDPRLRELLEREFDVIEVRGATQGTAMTSERYLVVHERAGPDAIIWEETIPAGQATPRASGQ